MIPLKTDHDLVVMRQAGIIVARVLRDIRSHIRAGVTTRELDLFAEASIKNAHARPAFKGYRGYPATICASVNDVIVHGIPGEHRLSAGDIISIDVGAEYKGFFSDAASTYTVGATDSDSQKLLRITKEALECAIAKTRAGVNLSEISGCIQDHVEAHGFNVIRAFVGHGIGIKLHEPPEIPNFRTGHNDCVLKKGMVLAIDEGRLAVVVAVPDD